MPLPKGGNTPWPPPACEPVNDQIHTWAAWYAGDIDQLSAIYGGAGAGRDTTGFFASEHGGFKPLVRRAGQAIRRWFWGDRRSTVSQPRTRLHVPIASDIASASADLLFSEPPAVTVAPASVPGPDGEDQADTVTQDRLNELLDDGAHATLLEAAEICAALGGVYLRLVWDPTVRDRPWLTAIQPDVAVPEWTWGRLAAVTFWQEIARKGKTVVRHLERHEPGLILHGVYEGTNDELGRPVSLGDYPQTAGLAAQLTNGNEVHTGADALTAVYVPNMRPNRLWRTNPDAAYLGRSDLAGVEQLMDALDMTYSSWMRDVELGKARLIVPQDYLRSNGPGKGATVDLDQEVYEGINTMAAEDGATEIKEVQFAIRHVEHGATITELKTGIVTSAGYSAQTFGLGVEGRAVTATEIAAKNRRSMITRDRKVRYWRPELADIIEVWLTIDAGLFHSGVTPQRPTIEFADGVSIDPLEQAQTLNQLEQARAISTEQKVRTLHPDWDDDEVQEEVDKIQAEVGAAVTDPGSFTGLPGAPGGPGGPGGPQPDPPPAPVPTGG